MAASVTTHVTMPILAMVAGLAPGIAMDQEAEALGTMQNELRHALNALKIVLGDPTAGTGPIPQAVGSVEEVARVMGDSLNERVDEEEKKRM